MGLFKRRPKIEVRLPRTLRPGQTFTARVRLEAKEKVPVDWVDVELQGWVKTAVANGRELVTRQVSLVSLGARLTAATELPPGRSEFDVRFALPPNLMPCFRGQMAHVEYRLGVHASIPWWPDAKAQFLVDVQVPSDGAPEAPKPAIYSSAPEGPRQTEPYAELSLADSVTQVGGKLAGAIALGNVAYARYAGLDVSLVVTERARVGELEAAAELGRYVVHLPVASPKEAEPIPFRIRLPDDAPPTLQHAQFDTSWSLELRAKRRLARDLTFAVPIVVLPRSESKADARPAPAPPVVGSDRTHELWRSVGEKHGLELVGDELHGQVGEVSLRIFREHRGSRGIYLTAELAFPSLHLGLDGGRREGFRRLFHDHGVSLDHDAWDRAHYITATHANQVEAFAAVMAAALREQRTRDLSDEHIVLELTSVGVGTRPLASIARAALEVARALPKGRAAIPPPPGFELDAWLELAQGLAGELEKARMVVKGELEGQRASVETEWSGDAALSTRVGLRPRQALAGRYLRTLSAEGAHDPEDFPSEARAAVGQIFRSAQVLEIQADALSALLPAPLPRAEGVREVLGELARLSELCAAKRSAYR